MDRDKMIAKVARRVGIWLNSNDPVCALVEVNRLALEKSLITCSNSIVGVRSTSKEVPMKVANFPKRYTVFSGAKDYSEWQFVFLPSRVAITIGGQ